MGATRVMMTMAVLGIAAGAYLAAATLPSFAPYRQPERSAPVMAAEDAHPYDLAQPRPGEDDFRLRPGADRGTIVLDLPRWAEDTSEWMAVGQRAWRAWQNWDQPDPEPQDFTDRHERRSEPYGYAPRDGRPEEPRYEPRYGRPDDQGYDRDAPWSRRGTAPERGSAPLLNSPEDDAAAEAAQRAERAASDVLGALAPQ